VDGEAEAGVEREMRKSGDRVSARDRVILAALGITERSRQHFQQHSHNVFSHDLVDVLFGKAFLKQRVSK